MPLFDTDILIHIMRGNLKAAGLVDAARERLISVQSYMELLQGTNSKHRHVQCRGFLKEMDFRILPFSENIGHRAAVYIEEYAMGSGLRAGDAVIAATAVENNLPLSTANVKHFRMIRDMDLQPFKP